MSDKIFGWQENRVPNFGGGGGFWQNTTLRMPETVSVAF